MCQVRLGRGEDILQLAWRVRRVDLRHERGPGRSQHESVRTTESLPPRQCSHFSLTRHAFRPVRNSPIIGTSSRLKMAWMTVAIAISNQTGRHSAWNSIWTRTMATATLQLLGTPRRAPGRAAAMNGAARRRRRLRAASPFGSVTLLFTFVCADVIVCWLALRPPGRVQRGRFHASLSQRAGCVGLQSVSRRRC